MKKLFTLLGFMGILYTSNTPLYAQCTGNRYRSEIFTEVTKTTVTYSTPNNLKMDIFEPAGDAETKRPLVILAFGGSFIAGSRSADATVVNLCNNLAKKGYVTASIDYRLGTMLDMIDSAKAIKTVVRAISDGKAALRYFVKDAATTNTYKVDTNAIFAGGNSAGAVLFMHIAYLDSLGECSANLQYAINQNGGFDGDSGNEGYNFKIKGVLNFAGGLNTSSFISAGNPAAYNIQGDRDSTVPYNCAKAMSGISVTLCGMGALENRFTAANISHVTTILPGKKHCPWSDEAPLYEQLQSEATDFLYSKVCDGAAGINDLDKIYAITLFPNPAQSFFTIKSEIAMQSISLYDITGRQLAKYPANNAQSYTIHNSNLSPGIYMVTISTSKGATTKRLIIQ